MNLYRKLVRIRGSVWAGRSMNVGHESLGTGRRGTAPYKKVRERLELQLVAGIGLLCLLLWSLLSGCANEPPSAQTVLELTAAAMDNVESVHMEVDIQYEGAEAETYIVVDLEPTERSHLVRTDRSGAFSGAFIIETELIVIGRDTYLKDSWTGEWEEMAPSEQEPELGAFSTGYALEMAERFSLVGKEVLYGESVYHLKGAISGEARSGLLDGPYAETGGGEVEYWSGTAEYWVGVKDFLVRRAVLQTEVPVDKSMDDSGADTLKTKYVAILSDYGKPVDVQAPEV